MPLHAGSSVSPLASPTSRRALACLALLMVLVMGTGSTPVRADAIAPPVQTSSAAPRSALQLGVQMFSMWRDWDTHVALMDAAVRSGTSWLRVDVGWCSLEEHGRNTISQWYLDRLDTTVADARARGLKLLLTLTCTPTWAAPQGAAGTYPTNPRDFQTVARYLATRYRGRVAAWELWNEPDCMNGGCPNGSPLAYLPVLRAGFYGIRAGDPSALVLNGGLSGVNPEWIHALLAAGGGRYFDRLALHPYLSPASAPPSTPAVPDYTNPYRITNIPAARALMVKYGYASKPIWLTEFGWTTGHTYGSPYDGVSEAVQGQYLYDAVALLASRYPYVQNAFWYTIRDRDDSTAYEDGFGVLRTDGSPKPAFFALQQANSDLRDGGISGQAPSKR